MHIGQKVTATADARKGETFAAKVTAIEPAINSSTGLVDVQATFEPEDGAKLLSGMFTRLNVALPTDDINRCATSGSELQNVWRIALYFDRTFR